MYPPQQPYVHYAPPPRRPSRAPFVAIGCLGMVIVGFAVLIVLVALAGSNPATMKRATQSTASSAASKAKAAPSKKAAVAIPTIGDWVKDGDLSFKVTKYKPGPNRVGNQYVGANPQGAFWLVYVTVKNHSDEPAHFSSSGQNLLVGNKQYAADGAAAAFIKDSASLFTPINPGNEVDGIMVFDLPKSAKPTAIELHDSTFSRGVKVALTQP